MCQSSFHSLGRIGNSFDSELKRLDSNLVSEQSVISAEFFENTNRTRDRPALPPPKIYLLPPAIAWRVVSVLRLLPN